MSRNEVAVAASGQKRPTDDSFDPLNSPISLKSTPPYDVKKEQAPFSVSQSKDYAAYKTHEENVKQLLKETLASVQQVDRSLQGLIDTINKRVNGREPQKIVLCLTGPMGTGRWR